MDDDPLDVLQPYDIRTPWLEGPLTYVESPVKGIVKEIAFSEKGGTSLHILIKESAQDILEACQLFKEQLDK